MITKTGIHVDESSSFTNPQIYEENGEVNHVVADNLTPSTRYYTRAYVVSDGTTIYSGNIKSFETLAPAPDYFTIKNEYAGQNNITLTKNGYPNDIVLEYTVDNGNNWISYNSSIGNLTVTLNQGQSVKFRGTNSAFSESETKYFSFDGSQMYSVSGNVMYLVDSTGNTSTMPSYMMCKLFYESSHLKNASNLNFGNVTYLSLYALDAAFEDCYNMEAAPDFSSITTIGPHSLSRAFALTFFTNSPDFSNVTTVSSGGFSYAFYSNQSLVVGPDFSSLTSLEDPYQTGAHFYGAFYDTGLTSGPDFSGLTSIPVSAFYQCFKNCSSLLTPPDFSNVTRVNNDGLEEAFMNCSSLTSAPDFSSVTTVYTNSFSSTFKNCTSLVTPADFSNIITLNGNSNFVGVYSGCSSLNHAIAPNTTVWETGRFTSWLLNCNSTGTVDIPAGLCTGSGTYCIPTSSSSGIPTNWNYNYLVNYFTIKNEYAGNNSISLTKNGTPTNNITLYYSTDDGSTWTTWSSANGDFRITLNQGQSVKFRGNNNTFSTSSSNYYRFDAGYDVSASGNIMTLVDSTGVSTTIPCNYCFCRLFVGVPSLVSITNLLLPATTLTQGCYYYLFSYTGITSIPSGLLPATTLAQSCYTNLFANSRITSVPSGLFPATTLAPYCYDSLFDSCSALTSVPSNLLPATTLADYCYRKLFNNCTSLTSAPALPATTLAQNCYNNLFRNCSSLNSITTYATQWNYNYTSNFVYGVAMNGDFYNLGGATIPTGTSGIPQGWAEHTSL